MKAVRHPLQLALRLVRTSKLSLAQAAQANLLPDEVKALVGATLKDADKCENAMMLRSDMHTCYDAYHWGVWVSSVSCREVRFCLRYDLDQHVATEDCEQSS